MLTAGQHIDTHRLIFSMSTSKSLRQVFFGLPLFRFPWGFQLIQRLPCDVVGWLPQGVPDPSPSSTPHLLVSWQLVGTLPQVCNADGVGPVYLEDPSQAAVDEGLYFSGGGLRGPSCHRSIQKY